MLNRFVNLFMKLPFVWSASILQLQSNYKTSTLTRDQRFSLPVSACIKVPYCWITSVTKEGKVFSSTHRTLPFMNYFCVITRIWCYCKEMLTADFFMCRSKKTQDSTNIGSLPFRHPSKSCQWAKHVPNWGTGTFILHWLQILQLL